MINSCLVCACVCVCVCVGNFLISFQKALIRRRVRCKDEHHVVKVWKINKCSVQLEACFKTANGYSFLGLVLSFTAVMPACVFVFSAACTVWSHRLMRWMWRSRRPRKIRDSSTFKLQLHQKKGGGCMMLEPSAVSNRKGETNGTSCEPNRPNTRREKMHSSEYAKLAKLHNIDGTRSCIICTK